MIRGRLAAGETVLVQGAAGGVGTACLQVAKAYGARTIAVVSPDAKERVARAAGADQVVRSTGAGKSEVMKLTDGGAHLIIDPVGGDRFVDSLRALRPFGRLIVVGFAGGGSRKSGSTACFEQHRGDRRRMGSGGPSIDPTDNQVCSDEDHRRRVTQV
jgi:NADPH:quinone reductase-like Zn-dependent oxidoreductase